MKLRAEVRDHTYLPSGDATVEAHVLGPDGFAESAEMRPDPLEQGVYTADWTSPKPGSYLVEMVAKRGAEELGRDVLTFRREDGVAENFHVEQNRDLLQKLSSETGGKYYKPEDASKLGDGYQLFGSGNHGSRNAGFVGHADRVPGAADAAGRGMAAAPEVGCDMKLSWLMLFLILPASCARRRFI